jgi:hypothetical protein
MKYLQRIRSDMLRNKRTVDQMAVQTACGPFSFHLSENVGDSNHFDVSLFAEQYLSYAKGLVEDLQSGSSGMKPFCVRLALRCYLIDGVILSLQELQSIADKDSSSDSLPHLVEAMKFQRHLDGAVLRLSSTELHEQSIWGDRVHSVENPAAANMFLGHVFAEVYDLALQTTAAPLVVHDVSMEEEEGEKLRLFGFFVAGLTYDLWQTSDHSIEKRDVLLQTLVGDGAVSRQPPQTVFEFVKSLPSQNGFNEQLQTEAAPCYTQDSAMNCSRAREIHLFSVPSVFFPSHIDVVIYLIKAQESYSLVGMCLFLFSLIHSLFIFLGYIGGALDISNLISEIQRLRLPNQKLSITVHSVNLDEEPRLATGLISCRRSKSVLGSSSEVPSKGLFLDPHCLWDHLEHSGESLKADPRTAGIRQHLVRLKFLL